MHLQRAFDIMENCLMETRSLDELIIWQKEINFWFMEQLPISFAMEVSEDERMRRICGLYEERMKLFFQ